MEFDSSLQKMKCPYCDTVMDMEEFQKLDEILDAPEPDYDELPEDSFHWDNDGGNEWEAGETDNLSVFTCKSCGGEIVGDSTLAATECPYCGNNVVITGRFQGKLKPDYVIPFKLSKEDAMAKYKEHIKGKYLLPKSFASENHIQEIKGIYVPFWLFSSKVRGFARYEAENTRSWSDNQFQYSEVTMYDVFRAGTMEFENIPVDGSSMIPDTLMESLEPFDFRQAVPFKTAYLAGFFANRFDVDDKACEARASERLKKSVSDILRGTVQGYGAVSPYSSNSFYGKLGEMGSGLGTEYVDQFARSGDRSNGVETIEGKVKYAMYPVYMLSSTYEGKTYTFAMNGQTGKFVGDLPEDKKKSKLSSLRTFLITAAIVTLIAWFFS